MKLVSDFHNKFFPEIKAKYFPSVRHAIDDNRNYYKAVYTSECMHNGVLTYNKMIDKLAKLCKAPEAEIHAIASKYVADWQGFTYTPTVKK